MRKKKIFITGGAGFIGSHIVEKLTEDGHEVTVFDNFSSGTIENIKPFLKKIKIIKNDLLNYEALRIGMQNNDLIFHQAAQLEITTAINHPDVDVRTNIIGSLNVLRAAKENNIKKLVFASSACVYGEQQNHPVQETDVTMPNWEYGVSKLAVEKYCDIYANYEGLQIASLRYSIVYGNNEWYGRVLTIFIKRALENLDLVIFGKGNVVRDFINVEDVAHFNKLLVKNEWIGHKIFNVSSGKSTSIKQIAKIVMDIAKDIDNRNLKIINEDLKEGNISKHVVGRMRLPRELNIMHLDNTKAKKFVKWNPMVKLEEGIKEEYLWLKKNLNRWNKMSY